MSEPISTSGAAGAALVGIASALVGSTLGPLVTIAVSALIGTLVSLGEIDTPTRLDAAKYVARYVAMSVIVAGSLAYLVERLWAIPAVEMLALVAFVIGWVGNRWVALRTAVGNALEVFVGRKGAGQ